MIKNKKTMYERLKRGDFGNVIQTWNNLDEMFLDGYGGKIGIRSRKIGGVCIPETDLNVIIDFMKDKDWKDFIVYESPPNNVATIQGEVGYHNGELWLTYSTSHKPMREAFKIETKLSRGLSARHILKEYLWSASYDEIEYLLDTYDNHVVEFSAYSCALGIFKGRNAIIWEVRSY